VVRHRFYGKRGDLRKLGADEKEKTEEGDVKSGQRLLGVGRGATWGVDTSKKDWND